MKKNLTLWTVALTALIFSSCKKIDPVADPTMNSEVSAKRGPSTVTAITYGGQATGLNATITNYQNGTVVSNQTILAQTALLPLAGGNLSAGHTSANIPGAVTIETLSGSVMGQGGQTISHATAGNVNVTINGNTISATSVSSTATATCSSVTGSSQFQNLVVNGATITVTGAPNQAVYLPGGGFILINEQTSSKKSKTSNINVSALHIIIPGSADIRIATVRAEVKC